MATIVPFCNISTIFVTGLGLKTNVFMKYNLINPEYLDSVSEGDPEIVREIVDIFRDQTAEIHSDMEQLLSQADYTGLGLLAHKAKASASIMGMKDLAVMLKTFELDAMAGKEPDNYSRFIVRFRDDTMLALEELENLIINMKASANDKK